MAPDDGRSPHGTRRFLIASALVVCFLITVALTLFLAVGYTSDPHYLRKGTVNTRPTVNIRGQLDR